MTRWLVTGAGGMLASDLLPLLAAREGDAVTAVDRAALDITDATAVAKAVPGHDVVVNCAAWTKVDDAETEEPQAFTVNAVGAANLARACASEGARLVHVSTDYVFDGEATTPYAEDAPLAPRSAYGRTKAAGEWAVRAELPAAHWILRSAWLYGGRGPSFVHTMARFEASREFVDVVDDQHGQPTWTHDVAARIIAVVDADLPAGTYHATSSGRTTWHGLAEAVFELLGADPARVHRTTSEAFVRPAPRPSWSVLGHDAWARVGLDPLPHWQDSLRAAVRERAILGSV